MSDVCQSFPLIFIGFLLLTADVSIKLLERWMDTKTCQDDNSSKQV